MDPADTGACLLKDGLLYCGEPEETASNMAEQGRFPGREIGQCLDRARLEISDIDLVALGIEPGAWARKIVHRAILQAPRGGRLFLAESRQWLARWLWVNRLIFATPGFRGRILYCPLHTALAAGLFPDSTRAEAAYLIMDSGCSRTAQSWGTGSCTGVSAGGELPYPHSLELICRAFARLLPPDGDRRAAGPGRAGYTGKLLSACIDLKGDGSFSLNPEFFDFFPQLQVNEQKLRTLLGTADAEQPFADDPVAEPGASVRSMLEEILFRTLVFLHRRTGLCKVHVRADTLARWADIEAVAMSAGFSHCRVHSTAGAAEGAALFALHTHLGRVGSHRPSPAGEVCL